jgi:heat shock protein HtpX
MAHELSHIKNYDILLSTIISVFVGFVIIITDVIFRTNLFRKNSDRESNGAGVIIQIVGVIFLILSPIFANLIQLAISRKREYLADASSVEITRNPEGLISALKKLDEDKETLKNVSKATAHMYISDPFKKVTKKENSLFSTHPPISERIARLEHIN